MNILGSDKSNLIANLSNFMVGGMDMLKGAADSGTLWAAWASSSYALIGGGLGLTHLTEVDMNAIIRGIELLNPTIQGPDVVGYSD